MLDIQNSPGSHVEIQILACDNTASLRIVCDGTRYRWMRIWIAIRSFGTAEDASGTNACVANPINPWLRCFSVSRGVEPPARALILLKLSVLCSNNGLGTGMCHRDHKLAWCVGHKSVKLGGNTFEKGVYFIGFELQPESGEHWRSSPVTT